MARQLVATAALLCAALFEVEFARAEILIGAAGPLTGPNAYIGDQAQQGAEMAVADLNARGGVLGQQVRLIVIDDACDAGQAVAAAQKLVSERVVFVVGHLCSSASIAAAETYERAGVIMISPGSTNPAFTEQGHSNVFRVCGRDDHQGAIAARHLANQWRDKKIAILHDETTYGKGLADATKLELNRLGVSEALYEGYRSGTSDYYDLARRLIAAEIDVVYVGGYYQEIGLIIREVREQGSELQLVSGDALATEGFWQVAGPAAEGTLFTFFPDPRLSPVASEVVEQFRNNGFEPEGYTLTSYAAVQVWAQAAERADATDTTSLITALRINEFNTVLGKISFDRKGDIRRPAFVWYLWKDGRYAPTGPSTH
jgi:branched-chain amino acid transport system substrate-binding protein